MLMMTRRTGFLSTSSRKTRSISGALILSQLLQRFHHHDDQNTFILWYGWQWQQQGLEVNQAPPELLQHDHHDDHDSDDNGDNGDWHCKDNMTTKMDLMDFPNQCATTSFSSQWVCFKFELKSTSFWLQDRATNIYVSIQIALPDCRTRLQICMHPTNFHL